MEGWQKAEVAKTYKQENTLRMGECVLQMINEEKKRLEKNQPFYNKRSIELTVQIDSWEEI